MISNDEWQNIARDIEMQPQNWSSGNIGVGHLNRGHSDSDPNNPLAASTDDNEDCVGTNNEVGGGNDSCGGHSSQRRTHVLSNGEVIWDFSGNVVEFMLDTNSSGDNYDGGFSYISQVTSVSHSTAYSLAGGTTTTARIAKDQFGPSGDYSSLNSGEFGGLGRTNLSIPGSGVSVLTRGGNYGSGVDAGPFTISIQFNDSQIGTSFGYRCVLHP